MEAAQEILQLPGIWIIGIMLLVENMVRKLKQNYGNLLYSIGFSTISAKTLDSHRVEQSFLFAVLPFSVSVPTNLEHDLANMGAAFHACVGSGRLGKVKGAVDHRMQPALIQKRPDVFKQLLSDSGFGQI